MSWLIAALLLGGRPGRGDDLRGLPDLDRAQGRRPVPEPHRPLLGRLPPRLAATAGRRGQADRQGRHHPRNVDRLLFNLAPVLGRGAGPARLRLHSLRPGTGRRRSPLLVPVLPGLRLADAAGRLRRGLGLEQQVRADLVAAHGRHAGLLRDPAAALAAGARAAGRLVQPDGGGRGAERGRLVHRLPGDRAGLLRGLLRRHAGRVEQVAAST